MSQCFPKPFELFDGETNVRVELSKSDLKNAMAKLKAEVDKLDVDKLKTVPTDLGKPSNVVDNDIVNKNLHDLVTKVNGTDTSKFVLKSKYDTDKSSLERKIPRTSGLSKKQIITKILLKWKVKIPNNICLATNAALNEVENKIPNVSSLVKKQIMLQKYQILKVNTLPRLIIINLRIKCLVQK